MHNVVLTLLIMSCVIFYLLVGIYNDNSLAQVPSNVISSTHDGDVVTIVH